MPEKCCVPSVSLTTRVPEVVLCLALEQEPPAEVELGGGPLFDDEDNSIWLALI